MAVESFILSLYLQPKAKRTEWASFHGTRIKVRVAAPPVDGRATYALRTFLAGEFKVSKRAVEVMSGEKGRFKQIAIHGAENWPPQAPNPGSAPS